MPKGPIPQHLLAVRTHADGRVFEYFPLRFRSGQFLGGTGLPPGRYKVRVTSTEGVHGDGEFTVNAGETSRKYVPITLLR
ncbi:MAG: hypothetical protein IIB61_09545 [Planctomycetes bacterium]|nr:hypothetical protein [Planctomycetota bacterium]